MTYLIDTDWVVDYLRGRLGAIALLDQLAPDGIAVSAMTVGEIYEGFRRGHDRERRVEAFERWLDAVDVLPVDRAVARVFGDIRGVLRDRGQDLDAPDLLIAATALHHDLTLVTRNLSHFRRVPGLRLHEPT